MWFCQTPTEPRQCIDFRAFRWKLLVYHTAFVSSCLCSDRPISLDVLNLLSKLLDFDFDFDRGLANVDAEVVETGGLGQDGGHFAVHLLKDKVHSFAGFIFKILQA